MEYQLLGNSELSVSRIALGCMSLPADQRQMGNLISQALEGGVSLFDTADLYENGGNELRIGRALKQRRNQVLLATKVGNQMRPDGSGWDWNPRKAYILEAVERSLRRLGTDHIDLYQLHGGTIDDPIDETIQAFELLKEQGKIRHYGISSIRPNVIREYASRSAIVSNMMQYSLLDRRPEEEAIPLLQQRNIGLLVRGSVAQGLLAGKFAKAYLGHEVAAVKRAAASVARIAGPARTAAQAALQYVLQKPGVTSVVLGASKPRQLEEALEVFSLPSLSATDLQMLDDGTPARQYTEHR
jgi:aryl-alcohol dehydrogenase-like predicted oxidoreductase